MTFDMQAIATSLENEVCPIHQQHPKAAVKDGDIQIAACCEGFNQTVQEKLRDKIAQSLENSLEEMLKGLSPE